MAGRRSGEGASRRVGGGTPPLPELGASLPDGACGPEPVAVRRTGRGTLRLALPGMRSLTVAARMWSAMGRGVLGMVMTSYLYIYGNYPFPFRFSSPEWTNL